MKSIFSGIVKHSELVENLTSLMEQVYSFRPTQIEKHLRQFVDTLRPDTWTYVEYPYVDKTYRSSYYTYFSTKHRHYERDSIRVALFAKEVSEDHFRHPELAEDLQKSSLGFFTIRPTYPCLFGRTMLSPTAMRDSDFEIALLETDAMINGAKLSTSAFPYSSQDTETISCAETTVWAIMEYYGNKYPEYRPVLPSTIVEVLARHAYERQLPSHGLTAEQISFALKEFGFGVRLYLQNIFQAEFKSLFFYYIDSGIPFAATVQNDEIGHAIVVIGHRHPSSDNIRSAKPSYTLQLPNRELAILDWSLIPREYVAVDDNYPPYRTANFEAPTQYYSCDTWKNCKISSIIVPLYSKIYLEALEAKKLALSLLKLDITMSDFTNDELVVRLFLTSSRSFKHKIAFDTAIVSDIKEFILQTLMPKFIWVMEITDRQSCCQGNARGMIVLDATEANDNATDALLFMALPRKFLMMKDHSFQSIQVSLQPFSMYRNNLKGGF